MMYNYKWYDDAEHSSYVIVDIRQYDKLKYKCIITDFSGSKFHRDPLAGTSWYSDVESVHQWLKVGSIVPLWDPNDLLKDLLCLK